MSPRPGDLFLSSRSDAHLVSLAREGHERAFAVIVERYRPELFAFARRLSSDGGGEDIIQQAFLNAFAALRSGAEVRHLRGWLYQIVRNAATRSRAPQSVPLDRASASGEALEDIVQQRALAMSALAEMARLPNRQRQAIVGTALDGRSRAEVAETMGLSEGAVRQLVHRARARLRTVVTAVVPWPAMRWFMARPGTGGAAELVAGAGVASTGGVAVKLGLVLASGAIATGVAAVDVDGGAHRTHPRTARPAARAVHRQVARPRPDRVVAVPPVAAVASHRGGEAQRRNGGGSRDEGGGGSRHEGGRGSQPEGGGGTSGDRGDGGRSRDGGGRGSSDGGGSDGGGGDGGSGDGGHSG